MADYNRQSLAAGLRAVGISAGDVVFSHSNVGYFGVPEEGRGRDIVFSVVLGAFRDVLGPQGTLVVPTFTYSFARGEIYDPRTTASGMGLFPEMLRVHPDAFRSEDPMFSVAAIGARARELTADAPEDSFGPGGFFDKFFHCGGIICNLNFDAGSTFVHYVERVLRIPYRYPKPFTGLIQRNGKREKRRALHWVRDLSSPETIAQFEPFDRLARETGAAHIATVGRGEIVALSASVTDRIIRETLPARPWLLTHAEVSGIHPSLEPATGSGRHNVPMLGDTRAPGFADRLARTLTVLPRLGVGPGVDAAFDTLRQVVPLQLRRVPTGTVLGDGWVPERWTLKSGRVADTAGKTLIDLAAAPHLVAPHSRSFTGRLTRDQLTRGMVAAPQSLDTFVRGRILGDGEWALSLPAEQLKLLDRGEYDLEIEVTTSFGALSVAELFIPGQQPETVVWIDLGTEDATDLVRAILWCRAYGESDSGRRALRLLIYPKPFDPKAIWPDYQEVGIPFATFSASAANTFD